MMSLYAAALLWFCVARGCGSGCRPGWRVRPARSACPASVY